MRELLLLVFTNFLVLLHKKIFLIAEKCKYFQHFLMCSKDRNSVGFLRSIRNIFKIFLTRFFYISPSLLFGRFDKTKSNELMVNTISLLIHIIVHKVPFSKNRLTMDTN